MRVGVRIQQLRQEARLTQRTVAVQADLSVEYLSRVENGRVTPSLAALSKIAGSLGRELVDLFGQHAALEAPDSCPVSLSGRCILECGMVGRGRRPERSDRYSADQLHALHLCDQLLHSSDREIVHVLQAALESLRVLSQNRARKLGHPTIDLRS
jgi:DNA-binding XRE family transcriptional regulator